MRVHGLCGRHNSGILREDADTNCVLMLERSISPLFHALAGSGRRCATLFAQDRKAFQVNTENHQLLLSEQEFGWKLPILSIFR